MSASGLEDPAPKLLEPSLPQLVPSENNAVSG
jgi:hypothetical protein